MEMPLNVQERPDVSAEERAMHEVFKRILKLRWMGMDDKAEQMRLVVQRVARPSWASFAADKRRRSR